MLIKHCYHTEWHAEATLSLELPSILAALPIAAEPMDIEELDQMLAHCIRYMMSKKMAVAAWGSYGIYIIVHMADF